MDLLTVLAYVMLFMISILYIHKPVETVAFFLKPIEKLFGFKTAMFDFNGKPHFYNED